MIATATCEEPSIGVMPADKYHADHSAISKSMLWTFHQRRRLYEMEYILGVAPPRKSSPEMDIGELAHAALLEPETLDERYVMVPPELLGSNGYANTKAAKEFIAENVDAGRIVIKADQLAVIKAMVKSVQHTFGDWLKRPSKREHAVHWTNRDTGLRLKCRPDWIIETPSTCFIFDVKTTADVSPPVFARRVEDYGYWLQHVHYSEGVQEVFARDTEFHFVVVETKFPFACNIQRIDVRSLPDCEREHLAILRDLKNCLDTGDFSEPWEHNITNIEIRSRNFNRSAA